MSLVQFCLRYRSTCDWCVIITEGIMYNSYDRLVTQGNKMNYVNQQFSHSKFYRQWTQNHRWPFQTLLVSSNTTWLGFYEPNESIQWLLSLIIHHAYIWHRSNVSTPHVYLEAVVHMLIMIPSHTHMVFGPNYTLDEGLWNSQFLLYKTKFCSDKTYYIYLPLYYQNDSCFSWRACKIKIFTHTK